MQFQERPDTTNRDILLTTLIGQGMSNDTLSGIVKPMRGKTQEEKEKIAERIMKEMGIE